MDVFWRKLISWSPLRRKGLTGSFEKRAQGPEGFSGTLLALPFVPLTPVYFVRYENKWFFFETLHSAVRTLQDVLLTCRVFSSSQKAIKVDIL